VINEASRQKREPLPQASTDDNPLAILQSIPGLDVAPALDAMGGLVDVYIDTAKLMARLLPERIEKMDKYVESDIKAFMIEVHGLKSVLKNIGASELGNSSTWLENAALENDIPYCAKEYPAFRAGLVELMDNLNDAFPKKAAVAKGTQDLALLIKALSEAKAAAEDFDRDKALELIAPHADFTYGAETD
jgi:HPt (histidine-containing phosphotransfer) domain-containing protein